MKRLLVTGRHGFVGETLVRDVTGGSFGPDWALVDVPVNFDLRDAGATARLVAQARPDFVLHLAGQSAVPESFENPESTLQVNLIGTLHLLQALTHFGFRGRLLYVGTGDVYGLVGEEQLPVAETMIPHPRNPYAVSKLAAEALCWQWHASYGTDIVLARPFNHIGPRQSERFAIASFARQVAEIGHGSRQPIIKVGDLDTTRDFTDVRDVVGAYFALLVRGTAGEVYNVCSGVEHSLRALLEQLITIAGVEVRIEQDPARLRRSEQRRMRGDPTKIRAATGWAASIPIDASLRRMLEYEQGRLTNG